MGRWEPGAAGRLERAAMELYVEHGYDRTTVAEIADRAGLTERTFFRHYADKREVLFQGSAELTALMVDAVLAAPSEAAPLDAVSAGVVAAGAGFGEDREPPRQRWALVTATPELRERELVKMATLGGALTDALRARGVGALAATVTAEAGVAVFRVAFEQWVGATDSRSYADHAREALDELRRIAG